MKTSELITKEDITVQWQTLAGKTEDSQKDQFAVADVTISAQGKVISQRKVSFIGKALDLAADAVERKGLCRASVLTARSWFRTALKITASAG